MNDLIDFKQAFDCVWQLLHILANHGIPEQLMILVEVSSLLYQVNEGSKNRVRSQ